MTDLRAQLQSTFGDAYTIERELGGGGMSRVFVATEQSLGRPVVVKVLPSETAGALSVERFRREIRLAASLQQANIVPVLSAGDAGGVAYYTMPFVKGESLRSHLAAKGALPVTECVAILRDVARALAFAHGEGVVHRDIKPENILLSGGTAVVTDFGIAKAVAASSTQPGLATLTQLGVTLGTPAYMAPEQAIGEQVDHRADIYALGVVAYEMLTGAAPFAGRSAQAMLAAHVMEAPAPLTDKRPDVAAGLVALITRCLAKEQADRPESATAVLIALDTMTTPHALAVSKSTKHAPTIAVLPLTNMSASADDEYFSDGVTEDIIAQLSRIASLTVIARTSVMRYKKTEKRPREIGTDLGASHVVEGSVRRAGQKLRIVAKLVDARSEATLWTETFDRDLADVFAIQSEVAHAVTTALTATLTPGERAHVSAINAPKNLDAYDAYLRGRFENAKGTPESYRRAIAHFERAIVLDENYANALAGLASTLWISAAYVGDDATAIARAQSLSARAMALDPLNAEACAVHAVTQIHDWNWDEAEQALDRAVALGPSAAIAYEYRAHFRANMGRPEQAIEDAQRAIALDPLRSFAHHILAYDLFQLGRFRESIASYDRALALAPDYAGSLCGKGMSLGELGDTAGTVATYRRCIEIAPAVSLAYTGIVVAYAQAGDAARAQQAMSELHDAAKRIKVHASSYVWAHAALGDADAAFAALEQMIQDREPWTICLILFRWFDPMRADPRFAEILRRLRFPDWSRAASDARRDAYAARMASAPKPAPAPAKPSIAVLPLTNMSASADDEYFSDGITEDIIAQLSQIKSLKVIARTSVMRYKKTEKTTKEIASELGVSHIATGSVRRAGQRLRIVAQLVDARTEEQVWARTFDRDCTDVFAIQTEVAEAVATALASRLTPDERARLAKPPTQDMQAYNLFVLGRHHYHSGMADAMPKAATCFQAAIARDPRFARAYGWLALVYMYQAAGYWGIRPRDAWARGLPAARAALSIDPDIAEAHHALSHHAHWNEFDRRTAEIHMTRALQLNSNDAFVHVSSALHHIGYGDPEKTLDKIEKARELDPTSLLMQMNSVYLPWCIGRFDVAQTNLATAEEINPTFPLWTVLHAVIALGTGRPRLARPTEETLAAQSLDNLSSFMVTAYFAAHGEHALARRRLADLHARESTEYVWPTGFAIVYGYLGDIDRALEYLERAYEDRAGWMTLLRTVPCFEPLRDHPRLRAIVARVDEGFARDG